MEDVVEFSFVLFLEVFAQIFGSDKAGFAVGQLASSFFAKRDEGGVRKANDECVALVIQKKFCVDGVGVARGDAIPHVRKPAVVNSAGEL